MPDLDAMWSQADAALRRCLELAHQSFLAGGLPVGSVIAARSGETVSEGRNRAYDPAGGADRLQRTPLAHAEMNALADPGGIAAEWTVAANLLFLSGVAAYSGPSSPMIVRAEQREPEITRLTRVVGDTSLRQPALREALVPAWPYIQAAAMERRSRHGRGT